MKQRKRNVFGKRRIKLNGVTYLIAMRKDHVMTRELRSRREFSMSLMELVDALIGQRTMRLHTHG